MLPPVLIQNLHYKEGTPMLLQQATVRNVSRALREIKAFEWEEDFKPKARQALKSLSLSFGIVGDVVD